MISRIFCIATSLVVMMLSTVAGAQPQATFVPASTIRAFLEAQKLASAATSRPGVDAAKSSLVRVICVRK